MPKKNAWEALDWEYFAAEEARGLRKRYVECEASGGIPVPNTKSEIIDEESETVGECSSDNNDGSLFDRIVGHVKLPFSNLCAKCQCIFNNWSFALENKRVEFPHYQNIYVLKKSSKADCALCSQFLYNWESQVKPKFVEEILKDRYLFGPSTVSVDKSEKIFDPELHPHSAPAETR
jgi:hypothetical protein